MKRQGLTILEVLVAVAIFLMAVVVIGQLLQMAGERAMEVRFQSEAAQLCQSKLAELSAGAIPFESQGDTPLEEDESWLCSVEAEQGNVVGVWKVRVSMARTRPDGARAEYCSVSQLILDPAARGSTMDSVAISGTEATGGSSSGSSSSSSSSNSSSSTQSSSGASGAAAAPSAGGGGSSSGASSSGGSSGGGSGPVGGGGSPVGGGGGGSGSGPVGGGGGSSGGGGGGGGSSPGSGSNSNNNRRN